MTEQMKFVIVGHVDHGKSTLIGRLFYDTGSLSPEKLAELERTSKELGRDLEFGFVMDHLEEERRQGITIDTAQTFFRTDKREYLIIDAPGHVEFTRNMITGASQAEAAVLIVDAQEGVREQTRRHAYILSLLGLKQLIVLINKMDLMGFQQERFDEVVAQLDPLLKDLRLDPTYTIPLSAKEGDNLANRSQQMPWYQGPTLLEALDTFTTNPRPVEKPMRLPIQDVYKVDDKRILVGRLETGRLQKGQKVIFLPDNAPTTIETVELFQQQLKEAQAGQSIGVTLSDPLFIERGTVACDPDEPPTSTDTITARVFWLAKQGYQKGDPITLQLATQEVECTLDQIHERTDSNTLKVIDTDADHLEVNDIGLVTIKTRSPVVVEDFNRMEELGRFVLVKGMDTCAGGIVTLDAIG